ncbi:hypothetical protein ACQUY5_29310 [Bacillus cereus]|uniref:hypothetical protein n=1 Tax=Bacillus cereus TaxID=1396 RepID=UPI003D162EEB
MNIVEVQVQYDGNGILFGYLRYIAEQNRISVHTSFHRECEDGSTFRIAGISQVSDSRVLFLLESKERVGEETFYNHLYILDTIDIDFSEDDKVNFKLFNGEKKDFYTVAGNLV